MSIFTDQELAARRSQNRSRGLGDYSGTSSAPVL